MFDINSLILDKIVIFKALSIVFKKFIMVFEVQITVPPRQ